jgi:hypothetical protein
MHSSSPVPLSIKRRQAITHLKPSNQVSLVLVESAPWMGRSTLALKIFILREI